MSKLYLVGTPLGNLEDITLRALRILKTVDVIACEDRRVSLKLLNHFDIKPHRLITYHDHNQHHAKMGIVTLLQQGKSVAQISDAGMPGISDPGFRLVQSVREHGLEVEVIPGPSAVTMTHVMANFGATYSFHGFLKHKEVQRQTQLQTLNPGTHIFFGSPHRLWAELATIATVWGQAVLIFVGRELTKKFQTTYRGTVAEVQTALAQQHQSDLPLKGEFTIAIQIATPPKQKINKYPQSL